VITRRLGEVCEYDRAQRVHSGLPYVGMEHIESDTGRFVGSIDPVNVKSNTFRFTPKHVLYGRLRPYLNKVLAPDFDGHCSTEIFPLLPSRELSREFLRYWMSSNEICERINGTCTGARMPRANMDAVLEFEIPVPPLAEQRRIVGILDEAFAGIATAKANAEKNLRNARELFAGSSKTAFEKLGTNNKQKTLGEVCYVDRGSSPRPIKEYFTIAADGVNWIKIGDSVEGEKYITATKQKITPKGALESVRVKVGDFLLTNSMSFGRPYILKTDGCIHDGWYCLRLNEGLDPDYFYHLLSSAYVRDQFNRLASGSVVLNISSDLVKRALLPIPPLAEQRIAVKKLDALKEQSQRLESLYQQKLAALDALKKSLLHQAFSGGLITSRPAASVAAKVSLFRIPGLPPDDLHAGVLAMAYQLHQKRGNTMEFGHVKAEKIAHMVEARLGFELGRTPVKEAAGPLDFDRRRYVDRRANTKKWFRFEQTESGRYQFQPLDSIDFIVGHTQMMLGPLLTKLDTLLQWMLPMKWQQAEIVATVYAGWNNLLLDDMSPTDEQIVCESRENWHAEKLKIERDRFFKAIDWLRKQGVVPEGKGKRVVPKGMPHV